MKRLYVCSVFCVVFLGCLFAWADLSISDIWRWGVLRKTDILPVNSTLTVGTGGVMRVVDSYAVVESNRFTLAVTSNLAASESVVLSNGVYLSDAFTASTNVVEAVWPDGWAFSSYCETNSEGLRQWVSNSAAATVVWRGTNAWGEYPCSLTGYLPTNGVPVGAAVLDYYRHTVSVTNIFVTGAGLSAELDNPFQTFTTVASVDGTCTVSAASGSLVRIVADMDMTLIRFDSSGYSTNGVSRVGVELWAGTNGIVFDAATITNVTAPVVGTDTWTSIQFRRVADGLWKGRQL